MNKRSLGNEYEKIAADFMSDNGCVILERNYHCKSGEIDIIAQDREDLIFAEVKYRKGKESGYPEEAVNISKQRRICKTADFYRIQHKIPENISCRFDVIAIDESGIRYYKNAFMYCGGNY